MEEEFTRARMDYESYQGLVDQCDRALTVANENRGIPFTDIVPAEQRLVPVSPMAKTIVSEIRHLKTLVVDGDFRRGSLAGMLNLPDSPGLADVLQVNNVAILGVLLVGDEARAPGYGYYRYYNYYRYYYSWSSRRDKR